MSWSYESELPRIYDCVEVFLVRYQAMYFLDSSDLADIRQDSVVAWWQYVQKTRTKIPLKALARVIARRRLYDFIRKERRRHELNDGSVAVAVETREPVLGTDTILEEIHAMPEGESTLILSRIEGRTYREIAREQAVHERTIRHRWSKAKSRLRKRLTSRLRQDYGQRHLTQLACI